MKAVFQQSLSGAGSVVARGSRTADRTRKAPLCEFLAVHDSLTVFPRAEPPDLHVIHQRIQGNMEVLQDFVVKREEGRSRQEYLALLRRDMAAYYSYSDFLLTKLMDIFPLPEVGSCPAHSCADRWRLGCLPENSSLFSVPSSIQLINFLEANEVPRPVTIRTNTLKTRRRDLAQVSKSQWLCPELPVPRSGISVPSPCLAGSNQPWCES